MCVARLLWEWWHYVWHVPHFFALLAHNPEGRVALTPVLVMFCTAWFMIHSRAIGFRGAVSLQASKVTGKPGKMYFPAFKSENISVWGPWIIFMPTPALKLSDAEVSDFKKLHRTPSFVLKREGIRGILVHAWLSFQHSGCRFSSSTH